ncbi:MAG: Crp/Fnr family transcriptional regulator [Hyphomicrobiaceae bacterium]
MSDEAWITHFPRLEELDSADRDRLLGGGRMVTLPANSRIFGPGQAPKNYLLLVSGTVRVHQISESGREIVLYRVNEGQSCPLTTACLMGYEDYLAEAVAETEVTAVLVPRQLFDDLISDSPAFRQFVFTAFSRRVTDLLRIIDEIAFQRMDIRLSAKLLELADANGIVKRTHQELAAELGTAREVISRQLNELQRRGWLLSGRGQVELKDKVALAGRAALA